jgi:hypothetical protein
VHGVPLVALGLCSVTARRATALGGTAGRNPDAPAQREAAQSFQRAWLVDGPQPVNDIYTCMSI